MPEGQGEQVSHWRFSGIGYLTANDKDFSLALEMTIRESLMPLSLWIASPQSLVPSLHKPIDRSGLGAFYFFKTGSERPGFEEFGFPVCYVEVALPIRGLGSL